MSPIQLCSDRRLISTRNFDFILWGSQNALERSAGDWVKLLADADPRFKVESVNIPPKSKLALISVVWDA